MQSTDERVSRAHALNHFAVAVQALIHTLAFQVGVVNGRMDDMIIYRSDKPLAIEYNLNIRREIGRLHRLGILVIRLNEDLRIRSIEGEQWFYTTGEGAAILRAVQHMTRIVEGEG